MRDKIAVFDVETTGLEPGRHHRVVEIGIVVAEPDGSPIAEYETLVNPGRDIGAASIHGITASDVVHAPTFEQIAGDIITILKESTVTAGHNVSFDQRFLATEFDRCGEAFPKLNSLCTFRAIGGTLAASCKQAGVQFDGAAHRALNDARATAKLISYVLELDPSALDRHRNNGIPWPNLAPLRTSPFCREHSKAKSEAPPAFLQRLAQRVRHDVDGSTSEQLAYLSLLDRILEDRLIDAEEHGVLERAAIEWSLSNAQLIQLHTQYLHNLAIMALADNVISDSERQDLHTVARLLGHNVSDLDQTIEAASKQLSKAGSPQPTASGELTGKRVCFTGELQSTIGGEPISREMAEALADRAGLIVVSGVSKKLDLLVVADPHTQSGKAKKARDYGIRIVADAVFWRLINVAID